MKIVGEGFAGVATAATRVIELYCPEEERLFYDPYALRLLPPAWQILFRLVYLPGLRQLVLSLREKRMPGSLGSILCRTRYIDDLLQESLQGGIEQVVILGAGFDSRAYRIEGVDRVRLFEVDLPGSAALKGARVEQVLGAVPDYVTFVGIDFDRGGLGDELGAAGFETRERTLFIWEGVTQYLTAGAVDDTLRFVAGAHPGSAIVFTYVRRGLIDGTDRPDWFEPFLSFADRVGSPLRFGLDPAELAGYLADRGLVLISDVGAADYRQRYLVPLGRELAVFDGERAACAEVTGLLLT